MHYGSRLYRDTKEHDINRLRQTKSNDKCLARWM